MKITILTTFTLLFAILALSGCTANLTDPEIDFAPPVYVEQMPAKEEAKEFSSDGSIFGQGANPLFSDQKAMHVNDIVTVVISETTQSVNAASKQTSIADTSNLGGGLFSTGSATSGTGAGGLVGGLVKGVNGYTNASFNTSSTSNFTGAGTSTKDATFTTTISARVVKILQNGNYFISGTREILIDDQKQYIQISGVIRPYDIDQNNNINSSQMSDAKILYRTQGDVDRATKQGWGTKLVQSIWPF